MGQLMTESDHEFNRMQIVVQGDDGRPPIPGMPEITMLGLPR
jgi:hypothetical protein